MCDIVGCDQEPEYYDDQDNKMCEDCVNREMSESGTRYEDYELIKSVSEAMGRYI